ncbi:MAG: DinB family protein [Actinobacteria bacterium]|nr:DinB family protein [Actinomycetota bacterium]
MTELVTNREQAALQAFLGRQRGHVQGILRELSDEQLRIPTLPSGWTCLSLVRHLAVDVERFWFRAVFAGEPIDINDPTGWQPSPDEPAEATLELYRQEIARADAIIADMDLDAPPARWPDYFPDWRFNDAREIILHVITETATHAGHLDAARELIDGRTWLGPSETQPLSGGG